MSPDTIVEAEPTSVLLDTSALWSASFPSPELVGSAAALFERFRPMSQAESVDSPTSAYGELENGRVRLAYRYGSHEGPLPRLVIAPGCITVTSADPARAERSAERLREGVTKTADLVARELERDPSYRQGRGRSKVTSWSAKSRSMMTKRLAELDYAPLVSTGRTPCMVTLTLPGDWETVAPTAAVAARLVVLLRKRFQREFGEPMVGVWKREFQRRGAPHWHVFCTPPQRTRSGEHFVSWLSRTWADVVGHPDPAERSRHLAAGTGVDYAEGLRSADPRRLAVYFSKHGSYSAKDYQNDAPELWAGQSVGRFWGVWGLSRSIGVVEVHPDDALAVARTLRRYSAANSGRVPIRVWRRRIDVSTGEVLGGRYRRSHGRLRRMRGDRGYLVVNDGPGLASALSRMLDARRSTAAAGPVGFLP